MFTPIQWAAIGLCLASCVRLPGHARPPRLLTDDQIKKLPLKECTPVDENGVFLFSAPDSTCPGGGLVAQEVNRVKRVVKEKLGKDVDFHSGWKIVFYSDYFLCGGTDPKRDRAVGCTDGNDNTSVVMYDPESDEPVKEIVRHEMTHAAQNMLGDAPSDHYPPALWDAIDDKK